MPVFYFFAAIAIWLGILSVRGGLAFHSYVRRELARPIADYTPFVSLIAPFRGLDQGLRENLTALFNQNYPAYEIIFVTGRDDDPALTIVDEVRGLAAHEGRVTSRLVVSGDTKDSGQKVHNLRVAVGEIDPRSEVIAFVDTDARPHHQWLRSLVAPLSDECIGAASGYRWFLPRTNNLASHLNSVWNASIASALGEHDDKNFCWGGATAMRRKTFDKMSVADRWRGTVSDDFTLTRVLQEAKLPIHFVPNCLTASFEDCSSAELIEFTTRQLKITRVYAPHLWRAVLLGGLLFVPVFFGGTILIVVRALGGHSVAVPLLLLGIIFALGAAKAWIRWRAARLALANYGAGIHGGLMAHLFLWPLSSALFLYNAVVAAFSRRINWRGISYELKSPTEAVIIAREK
jgi:cellulose synthase/poly-beta-1,6-N-acetylglucosamine synthase-like glycosyltransferase